ncbi:hypothetical protein ABPG75_003177 [Micractinium tetrahymenae]
MTSIHNLGEAQLVAIFSQLSLKERWWRLLCSAPQLVPRSVAVSFDGDQRGVARLRAFSAWLVAHGAGRIRHLSLQVAHDSEDAELTPNTSAQLQADMTAALVACAKALMRDVPGSPFRCLPACQQSYLCKTAAQTLNAAVRAATKERQAPAADVLDGLPNSEALKEALRALGMARACRKAGAPAPPPSAYTPVLLATAAALTDGTATSSSSSSSSSSADCGSSSTRATAAALTDGTATSSSSSSSSSSADCGSSSTRATAAALTDGTATSSSSSSSSSSADCGSSSTRATAAALTDGTATSSSSSSSSSSADCGSSSTRWVLH